MMIEVSPEEPICEPSSDIQGQASIVKGLRENMAGSERDFIKTMYEQLWLSQRAGVSERLQLIYIFSVIFSGSLLILKENLIDRISLPLIIFLMLFSVFGVLFTLKVEGVLKARENAANKIVDLYDLSDLIAQYNTSHWVTKVCIGKLFPIFFSLCFCFLLFLLLNILFPDFQGSIQLVGVSVVLFLISAVFLWRLEV